MDTVNTNLSPAARGFVSQLVPNTLNDSSTLMLGVRRPLLSSLMTEQEDRHGGSDWSGANQHMIVVTFPTGYYLQLAVIRWRC